MAKFLFFESLIIKLYIGRKNMEEEKRYSSFKELYDDYQFLIDAEFERRHLMRLEEIDIKIKNEKERLIYQNNVLTNRSAIDKNRWKLDFLEWVQDYIYKEVYLRLPLPEESSIVDHEINIIKNRIVDTLLDVKAYRGKKEWSTMLRKAGIVADCFEDCMKNLYFDSKRSTFPYIEDKYSQEALENLKKSINK